MKKWKSDMLVENILCFQQTEVVGFVMALMKCTQAKNKKLKLGTGGLTMPEKCEKCIHKKVCVYLECEECNGVYCDECGIYPECKDHNINECKYFEEEGVDNG